MKEPQQRRKEHDAAVAAAASARGGSRGGVGNRVATVVSLLRGVIVAPRSGRNGTLPAPRRVNPLHAAAGKHCRVTPRQSEGGSVAVVGPAACVCAPRRKKEGKIKERNSSEALALRDVAPLGQQALAEGSFPGAGVDPQPAAERRTGGSAENEKNRGKKINFKPTARQCREQLQGAGAGIPAGGASPCGAR